MSASRRTYRRRLSTLLAASKDEVRETDHWHDRILAGLDFGAVDNIKTHAALTDAEVSVDDRLFETLDPTTRGFEHDGRRYLVTDTVGFIRRLPHQLVEGFAATLEETLGADLVLHVADASASEERLDEQIAAVTSVLSEIGAAELPTEIVLNKVDARMRAALGEVHDRAEREQIALRDAAYVIAVDRVTHACRQRGWV